MGENQHIQLECFKRYVVIDQVHELKTNELKSQFPCGYSNLIQ